MAKKVVAKVTPEEVDTSTEEVTTVSPQGTTEVPPVPKLLKKLRGKDVVLVEFVPPYVFIEDSEGTGYKLPEVEYFELLGRE